MVVGAVGGNTVEALARAADLAAHGLFPDQASGSQLRRGNEVVGSRLVGQQFVGSQYFHPRPSASGYADSPSPTTKARSRFNAGASDCIAGARAPRVAHFVAHAPLIRHAAREKAPT